MFLRALTLVMALSLVALPAFATDVDGPDDCLRDLVDMGDAPELIPAYPTGVLGHFPTCLAPSAPGNQQAPCPPLSTPPGMTGYVMHVQNPALKPNYWIGCYTSPNGPYGIDSDTNGKVNTPAVGISACDHQTPTDCVEAAWGMTFDQDECWGDTSDHGLLQTILPVCQLTTATLTTFNCGPDRPVYLNICIDFNQDGDWNDNFICPQGCAYEWAVVNALVSLPPGCGSIVSPQFRVGPFPFPAWMRVSLSDEAMPADYPWNGTVSLAGGEAHGGETEDYPVQIEDHVGVAPSTWGNVKNLYK